MLNGSDYLSKWFEAEMYKEFIYKEISFMHAIRDKGLLRNKMRLICKVKCEWNSISH